MTRSTEAPDTVSPPAPSPEISRGLVLLFAAACGIAAANLYYAQPLLATIATYFGTSSGTAGLIVTFTQLGYVAGLALLVPVGDLVSRRRLVPFVLVLTAGGLVVSAFSPVLAVLVGMGLIVGAGSVVAQVLVPMAASLASDERRGQVVGTVMSGLLLGILLARTISGLVAGIANWRTVYVMGAVLTLGLALVLSRFLPPESERARLPYRTLLGTTVRLLVKEPLLQRRAWFGALAFAAFSVFWTTLAFLLSRSPFNYSDLTIGLFGLIGAAGALCANFAGKWADQKSTKVSTLVFALSIPISFVFLWFGRRDLGLLIAGIVVLDIGVQGLQVTNQSMIYTLGHSVRSRVTSGYMVCYFAGGAIGSALANTIYDHQGWAGVCVLGAGIGIVATVSAVVDAVRRPATPHL